MMKKIMHGLANKRFLAKCRKPLPRLNTAPGPTCGIATIWPTRAVESSRWGIAEVPPSLVQREVVTISSGRGNDTQ